MSDMEILPLKLREEVKAALRQCKLTESQKEKVIEKIIGLYKRSCFEPGEAAGMLAAQSISEPATQMSTSPYEKLILKRNDMISIVGIGQFVDAVVEGVGKNVDGWDVCDISSQGIYVPSLTAKEKIEWHLVTACSRHKAPKKLIKITTFSGREITATESHSFVVRKDNSITPVAGSDLRSGDRIPVMKYLPERCANTISIAPHMPCPVKEVAGLLYTTPISKAVPSTIALDFYFGYFVGAYLAEGNSQGSQIGISNIDEAFISNIKAFVGGIGLDFKDRHYAGEFGRGRTLTVNSTILSKFIISTCGKGAKGKRVPAFAYSANDQFVSGLLRSYFDGDGNVHPTRKMIRASSDSKELLDGICLLLARFGIFAHKIEAKNKLKTQHGLLIPYKYTPAFLEKIGSEIQKKRGGLEKMVVMAEGLSKKSQDFTDMIGGFGDLLYRVAKKLKYPTRYVNNFTKRQRIGRTALLRYITLFERLAKEKRVNIDGELAVMRQMAFSDVIWDAIESVTEVRPTSEYVYDLTVEGTETFTTFEGIITHNTMRVYHVAGAAQIQVTLGLPRMVEIFDARRTPATPAMTVYLKSGTSKERAYEITTEIREVKVVNIAASSALDLVSGQVEVTYDPATMRSFGVKASTVPAALKEALKDVEIRPHADGVAVKPKDDASVKDLQKLRAKVLATHIKGLKGVEQAVVNQREGEWVVNTLGSNFAKVLLIEGVDATRTMTNNIHEVAKVLGIEAARTVIISEAVYTLRQAGLDVDVRHVMLVADMMTVDGEIKAIGRYGIAGAKGSVLARANFEETIKHLTKAAVTGEVDKLESIVENVMINQVVPAGTGMFDLVFRLPKKG